jgi:hypothetical protein
LCVSWLKLFPNPDSYPEPLNHPTQTMASMVAVRIGGRPQGLSCAAHYFWVHGRGERQNMLSILDVVLFRDWIHRVGFRIPENVPAKNPLPGGEDTGEGGRQNMHENPDSRFEPLNQPAQAMTSIVAVRKRWPSARTEVCVPPSWDSWKWNRKSGRQKGKELEP